MKIQDFKALNMKGKDIYVKIKKYNVDEEHEYLVDEFISYVNAIGSRAFGADDVNMTIQDNCFSLLRNLNPMPIEEIDYGLQILDTYFDLTQVKYFKIAGILAIHKNYIEEFPHKLMDRYFDNFKTSYVYI